MSLDRRATFMLRLGPPGAGKTWSLTRYVVDVFLPNHSGKVFTNLPLNLEAIRAYIKRRHRLTDAQAQGMIDRIVLFPRDHVEQWLDGKAIPASFFAQREAEELGEREPDEPGILSGALVLLDEAGKMWPNSTEDKRRAEIVADLARWCRTLRHEGARLIFIVQDEMQIDAKIRRLCTVQLSVINLAERREPITGALIGDWFQCWAYLTRRYITWIQEQELVKDGTGWLVDHQYITPLSPKYFPLYDSHNREGKGHGGAEAKFEWERFWPWRFATWLIARNAFNWGWRGGLLVVAFFLLCPPFSLAFRAWSWTFQNVPRMITEAKLMKKDKQAGELAGKGVTATVAGKKLGSPVEQMQHDLQVERAKRAELEQRLGASGGISLVHDKGVVTDEGDEWEVGKAVEFGQFRGHVVESVDVHRGRVYFLGGLVLRLRRRADGAKVDATNAELGGSLQRSGSQPGYSTAGAGVQSKPGELQRGRVDSDRRPPISQ